MRAASLLPQLGPFWRVVPASKDKQKLELYRWQTSNIGWEKLKKPVSYCFAFVLTYQQATPKGWRNMAPYAGSLGVVWMTGCRSDTPNCKKTSQQ